MGKERRLDATRGAVSDFTYTTPDERAFMRSTSKAQAGLVGRLSHAVRLKIPHISGVRWILADGERRATHQRDRLAYDSAGTESAFHVVHGLTAEVRSMISRSARDTRRPWPSRDAPDPLVSLTRPRGGEDGFCVRRWRLAAA